MASVLRTACTFLVFILYTYAASGQKEAKPVITGQTPSPIVTAKDAAVNIQLSNLIVTDDDSVYPNGFSLEVKSGTNYKIKGATVTPNKGFVGRLSVPVRVDDGKNKSDEFALQVEVTGPQNTAPVITGQSPLSTKQGQSISIQLGSLHVYDPDNSYPAGFTVQALPGNNYTLLGNTVVPNITFSGTLVVPVIVNDGQNDSAPFDLKITVTKLLNAEPKITGQSPLTINQGSSITIALSHLQVADLDNKYPDDFRLTLYAGNNYAINGTTITPSPNFVGNLKVPVTVNDGQTESKRFDLKVEVVKNQNIAPVITGQSPVNVNQGSSVTVALSNLQVTDPDNSYPAGFTLQLYTGSNYTVNGTTVTPALNFVGNLKVPVTVNDGQTESKRFDLKIEVVKNQNIAPVITGQSPLNVNQGSSVTVALSNLQVTDPDNSYPTGFSLQLYAGVNYTINGTTVTPSPNFVGNLKVPITVNDGQTESKRFDLKIEVVKNQNIAPVITGQSPLSMSQGSSLTVALSTLQVTDPDSPYPAGFTLQLYTGNNYTVNGTTVTPAPNFAGNLKVPVTVNDGQTESKRFDLNIDVVKDQNIAPVITGQSPLSMSQGSSLTVALSTLQVTDPDSPYPAGFTLQLYNGKNYTLNGNTIFPTPNFTGILTVPVSINDGQNESGRFDLKIEVIKPQNALPKIIGQETIKTNEDEGITIKLADLKVTDSDNSYPADFKLNVGAGTNYTFSGLNVTPAKNYFGILSVPVKVNDGTSESEPFNLQVTVNPVNDEPIITGQVPLSTNQNQVIAISSSQLIIVDPDNQSPNEFTVRISNGRNYSFAGNIISPAPGFTGTLDVNVAVNDGKATSAGYKLKIEVIPFAENVPPLITGQTPLSITQNTSLTVHLSQLKVTDPDNPYPGGFTLKVSPGSNYTVNGAVITPTVNFKGTLSVPVRVNDGKDDSAPFPLKVQVVLPTAKPNINGQKELVTPEDSTIIINLYDLFVTDADADEEYPSGFTLKVLPDKGNYAINGNAILPALNYNGFIEVTVTVNDGVNTSDPFKLAILVTPVDDAPEVLESEPIELKYEPGGEPMPLYEYVDVQDVDNDHLIMAEIGFRSHNYSPANDQLIFTSDSSNMRVVYDNAGTMFLIGYATINEYRTALRSIQYNYKLTQDQNGNPSEIIGGTRTVYINVYDGELVSTAFEKQISLDVKISLDIPSAFSPNGDHANDTWRLHINNADQVDGAVVKVYDKRGALLYEATGFEREWDGISNGQVLPVDTYYYTIDLNLPYARKSFKGAVTILH